jgi:hypothetical protein
MLLIITNKEDIHPNPVIEKLGNFPFLRLNSEDLLKEYKISWSSSQKEISWCLSDKLNNIEITSKNLTSVWERRPLKPKSLTHKIFDRKVGKFCRDEAIHFFQYFRYFLQDTFYIGHPLVDRIAQSRMVQHRITAKYNITCASSIYSNNSKELKLFASRHKTLFIKPIYTDSINYEDYYLSLGSVKISRDQIIKASDQSLESTINYLQEYIEKDFELRITVICDKVFACKLNSQELDEENGKIDWRDGLLNGKLKHEVFELPEGIQFFCINYLKEMNQHFGAFDFIVTPKGEYVFLECNSNGQWYWIELETGMNISGAIAEHLMKGSW